MTPALAPVRIRIKNFQSIEELDIEVRGFTCVTGKTNIGKSAIMRAVSRSLLNDPVTGMVRKGAKFSSVEMESSDWGFLWEKGEKDVNRYTIAGKVYDKTGQNQLPEVQSMGFRSIRVGDDEIEPWWAPQIAPMFLLNKSGPQITNFISEVSRLQIYQNAIVLAARAKRKCTDESRLKLEEVTRVKDKLTRIAGLETLEKVEGDIDEQFRSVMEYMQRISALEELKKDLDRAADRLRRTKAALDSRLRSDGVQAAVDRFLEVARCWKRLSTAANRIIAIKAVDSLTVPVQLGDEMERLRAASKCLKIVPLKGFVERSGVKFKLPDPKGLEADLERLRKVRTAAASVVRVRTAIARAEVLPESPKAPTDDMERLRKVWELRCKMGALQVQIATADGELKRLDGEKKALEKRLAAARVCPECGQRVPEEKSSTKRKSLPA